MNNNSYTYSKGLALALEGKPNKQMNTKGGSKILLSECTEFTLHVSQQSFFSVSKKKLVDYTEFKLRKYMKSVSDEQQRIVIASMLVDYLNGLIAVAWRRGQPVYVKVTKG